MKLNSSKAALFFPGLLIALCLCCSEREQQERVEIQQDETDPNIIG